MSTDDPLPESKMLRAGEWAEGTPVTICCPHDGVPVGVVHRAGPMDLETAIVACRESFSATRRIPPHRRAEMLRCVAGGIRDRAEEFARTMALESAKPIKQARVEVGRSASIFATAAEEAVRMRGEVVNLDAAPAGEGRFGLVKRFPVGPVAAITPFNFPLNQVAHKLAPAMATGCPVVVKPASQTPMTALMLAEVVRGAGWPPGALSVLPMAAHDARPLVEDPRFAMLSFTGSAEVGWDMKGRAGRKKVALELGGNAGVVVHEDADLDYAATRCAAGGFLYAGQSCISVQRIFVHEGVYDRFLSLFLPRVVALKVGHPLDESADLCSMISLHEAQRVSEWIEEARQAGAKFLTGGRVEGGVVSPTVIADASPRLKVNCREVFAPVVTVRPYSRFEEAIDAVNESDYGLQAGVFTRDVGRIREAFEGLEAGGIMVNEVATWRVDHMPYGGTKGSGFGREGVSYAMEEMTEPRLMALNFPV